MKQLVQSEWERLWKRKTTWLLFFSVPLVLLGAAKYLHTQNQALSTDLPQYAVAWNFPILGLSEMLITVFQGIILILIAFSVTEEYRTGQLRMVLIRSYSYQEILFAKFIVTVGTVLLFFAIYFSVSYLLGMIIFAAPAEFPLFYHQELATWADGLIYNVKFYGIAMFTVLAIVSILFFIGVVSHTTTTMIGTSIGYLLFSFAYPNVLLIMKPLLDDTLYMKLFFTSIPMIQWQGITAMLAEHPKWVSWNVLVISLTTITFVFFTFLVTRKKDSYV